MCNSACHAMNDQIHVHKNTDNKFCKIVCRKKLKGTEFEAAFRRGLLCWGWGGGSTYPGLPKVGRTHGGSTF